MFGRASKEENSRVFATYDENYERDQKKKFIDSLLTYELNLGNEKDTLRLCLNSLENADDIDETNKPKLRHLLLEMIENISDEVEYYRRERKALENLSSTKTGNFSDKFDLIKLRYNKLIIQIEKVFSSAPSFSDISNKVPKRVEKAWKDGFKINKDRSNLHENLFEDFERENEGRERENGDGIESRFKNLYNSYKNLKSTIGREPTKVERKPEAKKNAYLSMPAEKEKDPPKKKRETERRPSLSIKNQETGDILDKDNLKRELTMLKDLMFELKRKVETHSHEEYDQELNKLRFENAKIISDYKLIKRDNTEIMHSLHTLTKQAENLTNENKTLVDDISSIKSYLRSRGDNYRSHSRTEVSEGKKPKRVLLPSNAANDYRKVEDNDMLSSWAMRKLKRDY